MDQQKFEIPVTNSMRQCTSCACVIHFPVRLNSVVVEAVRSAEDFFVSVCTCVSSVPTMSEGMSTLSSQG